MTEGRAFLSLQRRLKNSNSKCENQLQPEGGVPRSAGVPGEQHLLAGRCLLAHPLELKPEVAQRLLALVPAVHLSLPAGWLLSGEGLEHQTLQGACSLPPALLLSGHCPAAQLQGRAWAVSDLELQPLLPQAALAQRVG